MGAVRHGSLADFDVAADDQVGIVPRLPLTENGCLGSDRTSFETFTRRHCCLLSRVREFPTLPYDVGWMAPCDGRHSVFALYIVRQNPLQEDRCLILDR